jgi:hypothetical protein
MVLILLIPSSSENQISAQLSEVQKTIQGGKGWELLKMVLCYLTFIQPYCVLRYEYLIQVAIVLQVR